MLIIDASAAFEWLLDTPAGRKVFNRISGEEVHSAHLLDVEVAQALRKAVLKRVVGAVRAEGALDDLASAQIIRHAHYQYLPAVWALRNNFSAYDAVYVALAEAHGAPLVTCDRRLAAAPGHAVRIEYIRP